jgi:hypothetical protein
LLLRVIFKSKSKILSSKDWIAILTISIFWVVGSIFVSYGRSNSTESFTEVFVTLRNNDDATLNVMNHSDSLVTYSIIAYDKAKVLEGVEITIEPSQTYQFPLEIQRLGEIVFIEVTHEGKSLDLHFQNPYRLIR